MQSFTGLISQTAGRLFSRWIARKLQFGHTSAIVQYVFVILREMALFHGGGEARRELSTAPKRGLLPNCCYRYQNHDCAQ